MSREKKLLACSCVLVFEVNDGKLLFISFLQFEGNENKCWLRPKRQLTCYLAALSGEGTSQN